MTLQPWRAEFSAVTSAPSAVIWALFRDVARWKDWNAGIESVEIHGPFAPGTWFSMQPPGQDTLRSRLIDVRENECFVDETCVGDLTIRVAHSIECLGRGTTRVTYAVEANGPDAAKVGAAVSSDFSQVLTSLVRLAEERWRCESGTRAA